MSTGRYRSQGLVAFGSGHTIQQERIPQQPALYPMKQAGVVFGCAAVAAALGAAALWSAAEIERQKKLQQRKEARRLQQSRLQPDADELPEMVSPLRLSYV